MMGLNFNFNFNKKTAPTSNPSEAPAKMRVIKTGEAGTNLVKKYFNSKLGVSYELEFFEEDGITKSLLKNVQPEDLNTSFKLSDDGPLDREEYLVGEIRPKDIN